MKNQYSSILNLQMRTTRLCLLTFFGIFLMEWEWTSKGIVRLVQFSRSVMSNSLRPHESQHARPPCPSPTAGVHPNPYPLNRWCHPIISSSVIPFPSCPQSFPASGSFQISQLSASGDQIIGVSASTSVLPKNNQDCLKSILYHASTFSTWAFTVPWST